MTDLISKKDLLQMTGISYGQLYRWKRENLIPEDWFVKKSSFTGQETFFPKEKIIQRMNMILELKDKYSLEELANMLSPESSSKIFRKSDFGGINEIRQNVVDLFASALNKDSFSFIELTFIYTISKLNSEGILSDENLSDSVLSINNWIGNLKDTSYIYLVCMKHKEIFTILLKQDGVYYLDHKAKKLKVVHLEQEAKELNEKLNSI